MMKKTEKEIPKNIVGGLVKGMKTKSNMFTRTRFRHIGYETNETAHDLARCGQKQQSQ